MSEQQKRTDRRPRLLEPAPAGRHRPSNTHALRVRFQEPRRHDHAGRQPRAPADGRTSMAARPSSCRERRVHGRQPQLPRRHGRPRSGEINANHLRPKRDGVLRAIAEPVISAARARWTIDLPRRRRRPARLRLTLHPRRSRGTGRHAVVSGHSPLISSNDQRPNHGHHSARACARRSSRWSGCATAISSSARCR